MVKAASDQAEIFSFPGVGDAEQGAFQSSKARLREIIEPRIQHVFSLVEERLASAALLGFASGRVILTGGGSQLLGLDQVWMRRFGGSVRIGRPKPLGRMPSSMCSPTFATAIGLVVGEIAQGAVQGTIRRTPVGSGGYFGRMRQWIGESF
jgi:cell division protein FtsA